MAEDAPLPINKATEQLAEKYGARCAMVILDLGDHCHVACTGEGNVSIWLYMLGCATVMAMSGSGDETPTLHS